MDDPARFEGVPRPPVKARPGRKPAADRAAVIKDAQRRLSLDPALDVNSLAAEVGISRSSIYRWFGSKEGLLGEVLWEFASDLLSEAHASSTAAGRERLQATAEFFIEAVSASPLLRSLLRRDPHGTVSILMSPGGGVQDRLIEAFERLIETEQRDGEFRSALDAHTLATLVIQTGMSFLFGTALIDQPPSVADALAITRRLLELGTTGPSPG